jgi:lipase chaperone LimK
MGSRWKGALFIVALASAAALFGARFLSAERPTPAAAVERATRPVEASRARSTEAAPGADAPVPTASADDPAPAVPRSLRGTDVDGALRTDAKADLIVGPEVAALFEYFLSATGEESPEAIKARIVAAIRERLDGRAEVQALALLDRYLDYRDATRGLRVESEDPAARLAAIRKLRRERFGAEDADRLFGAEEREGEVAIEASRLASDATLSHAEREARIAALEDELPLATREARAAARQPVRQQAEEQALREAGATEAELYAHRVVTVGAEAADRLAALDRQRAEWTRRLDAFRAERARLVARSHDLVTLRAEEDALLARDFTPEERVRVRAILSMAGE